jgi:mono/diheme cytochrome c family protein
LAATTSQHASGVTKVQPGDFERRRTMSSKTFALVSFTTIALTLLGVISVGARNSPQAAFDAAKTYKGKCVACHGPKADKKFDAAKSDDEHVQIILKGKKVEKPPNMPGYESKGINAEQAKALLDYMKSLRQ